MVGWVELGLALVLMLVLALVLWMLLALGFVRCRRGVGLVRG